MNVAATATLLDRQAIAYEMERRRIPPKLEFLWEPWRIKGARGGRGAGAKSWTFARTLLQMGAMLAPPPGLGSGYIPGPKRIVCARETMESIKGSVHALLCDQIKALGLDAHYIVQRDALLGRDPVTGQLTGTSFRFIGLAHDPDAVKSLEGADILWIEEAGTVSRESFLTVVPTIRKPGSEIWLTWNPGLETDEVHQRFVLQPPPGAKVVFLTIEDNPWYPEVLRIEADHLKRTDPKEWEYVYGGECRSSVQGAVYADEIKQAATEDRISSVPVDRSKPVDTYWDLGYGDATAIWFAQPVSGWFHIVDYIEDSGKTIEQYLIMLQQRGYLYGTDWLPHDAVDTIVHSRLAGGDKTRSIEMLLRAAGRKVRIAPKMHVATGINAVRTVFPQCRFDAERCKQGLHALRSYQWGPPGPGGLFGRAPLHDWSSHGADAFRTLATQIKIDPPKVHPKTVQRVEPPRIIGAYAPFG